MGYCRTLPLVLMGTVNLTTLISNATVFFIVSRSSVLRYKVSSAFILAMFLVGFLASLTIMPMAFANYLHGGLVLGIPWCKTIGFLNSTLTFSNCFLLFLITLDRYFAIVHPMYHSAHLDPIKGYSSIAVSWFLAILLAALPFTGWTKFVYDSNRAQCGYQMSAVDGRSYTTTILVFVYAIPSTAAIIIYCFIFREAKVVKLRIRPSLALSTISGTSSNIAINQVAYPPACEIRKPSKPKKFSKATKTLTLLFLHYLICYLPDVMVQMESIWDDGGWLVTTGPWTLWLSYASFAIQPLLYGLYDRSVRKEIVRYLRCRKRTTTQRPSLPTIREGPTNFAEFLKETA